MFTTFGGCPCTCATSVLSVALSKQANRSVAYFLLYLLLWSAAL